MPAPNQKITFGEMRSAGVRGLLIFCADFRCSHSVAIIADQWSDHVRLSDKTASHFRSISWPSGVNSLRFISNPHA